jgi:hypothetical protein
MQIDSALFFNFKIMNKKVKVCKTLIAEETLLGEGAILLINKASQPLISFLRKKYSEDPDCLKGDIEFLFKFDGIEEAEEILENYERLWRAIKMPNEKKRKCTQIARKCQKQKRPTFL